MREVPASARVLTNDARIVYCSQQLYGETLLLRSNSKPTKEQMDSYEYFVVRVDARHGIPPAIDKVRDKKVVRCFQGDDGWSVIVMQRTAPNANSNHGGGPPARP